MHKRVRFVEIIITANSVQKAKAVKEAVCVHINGNHISIESECPKQKQEMKRIRINTKKNVCMLIRLMLRTHSLNRSSVK